MVVKTGFKMTFGGVDLMRWIDGVKTIERDVGQNMTNSLIKIGREPGEHFQYTSPAHGTITVTALILNKPDRRALASALTVDKPQQLVFGDEPDKYYLAIADGQATLAEAYFNNVLTLTFIVPDGIAHSVATQTADNMPYKDLSENLFINSDFTGTMSNSGFVGIDKDKYNGSNVALAKSNGKNYQSIMGPSYRVPVSVSKGDSITIQWAEKVTGSRTDGSTNILAFLVEEYPDATGARTHFSPSIILSPALNNWVKGSYTYQIAGDDTKYIAFVALFTTGLTGVETASIALMKMELGDTASPWSPNPSDPEYYTDTITVKNDGTYPVYPVIEATMHSDNGVISLINEDNGGVLEFGNSEEVDGVTEHKSEQVIHYTFAGGNPDAGLTVNAGTMFYNDSGRSKIAGGFVDPGSGDAVTPTFTGTSSDRWNGPTLYGAVPASAEGSNTGNFLYTNRINFPAAIGHTGRIELILGNDKGMQMVFVIREATLTRKQLIIEGWCMGQMLVNKTLDLNAFNSDFMEVQMGRIGANLLFQIAKISKLEGDVPVYASKLTFTPTYSDFAAVPISNMTTWFARFGATNASKLTWTDSKFEWTNISFWNDTANQYSAGDVLIVDTANRSVALNGVLNGGLQRIGNDWSKFKLQPGTNKFLMVTSSFAKTPEVRISYKEAWL